MKRLLLTLTFIGIPSLVFAQDGGGAGLDLDLLKIVGLMITGVGVPLATMILIQVWPKAPAWLKAIAAPVLVPFLIYLAGMASAWLGIPISFQDIIDVILTVAPIGAGASMAYTLGKRKVA